MLFCICFSSFLQDHKREHEPAESPEETPRSLEESQRQTPFAWEEVGNHV